MNHLSDKAFFDIQVNGYVGADFCSENLTREECHRACQALRDDGVGGILATLITDRLDALERKLHNLVQFRKEDSLVREMIAGFHVEGPFISPKTGFVGAHPAECVCPANVNDAGRLLDAGEGLVRLITLAPEYDEACQTTAFLAAKGVTVSAGHCDPDLDTLKAAIDAGLSMVTHVGNGCPVTLPRHDNFVQRVLSLAKDLWLCFIPDGVHVEFFALKNYLRICGIERAIMVTDAIVAAGLGPGAYDLSGAPVEIDEDGVARRPGSPNLAGSTIRGPQLMKNLAGEMGMSEEEIQVVTSQNPRKAVKI